VAERLTVLHELLGEFIALGEALDTADVTRRQHIAEVLDFLARHGGLPNRSAIGAHLSLGQANLTRVLNLMSAGGLVERSTLGKEASFTLSRSGPQARRTRPRAKQRGLPESGSASAQLD
jgi:DNA-binding MarR family transcriptional regulator